MNADTITILASTGLLGAAAFLVRNIAGALKDRGEAKLKEAEAARLKEQNHGTEAGTADALVRALVKRVEASEARCGALEADREAMRDEMDAMRGEMAECERRSIALQSQVDQMTAAFISVRPDRCGKCGGIVAAG